MSMQEEPDRPFASGANNLGETVQHNKPVIQQTAAGAQLDNEAGTSYNKLPLQSQKYTPGSYNSGYKPANTHSDMSPSSFGGGPDTQRSVQQGPVYQQSVNPLRTSGTLNSVLTINEPRENLQVRFVLLAAEVDRLVVCNTASVRELDSWKIRYNELEKTKNMEIEQLKEELFSKSRDISSPPSSVRFRLAYCIILTSYFVE